LLASEIGFGGGALWREEAPAAASREYKRDEAVWLHISVSGILRGVV
jgi:hypothetical protein